MKRFLISTVSVALSLGMVSPAFAYITNDDDIKVQTSPYHEGRPARRLIMTQYGNSTDRSGIRRAASPEDTGLSLLRRASIRRFRRFNRMPKPGSDRYRILDLRPNTRFLRSEAEDQSWLPSSLITTGGSNYDRPTRRDIRENSFFNQVNDRNRDILEEMTNNQR